MQDENNDVTGGLFSNMTNFFADEPGDKPGGFLGGAGALVLHLIVIAAAIYSGYHGIHASAAYREAQGLGNAAGIIGILIIEFTMLGIYFAYFYQRITGDAQKWIAGITMAIGFVFACLGIVGDSQMQAGVDVTPWLSSYLRWGLPFAPMIMALGAALTLAASPAVIRKIKAALNREKAAERRHDARMKADDARLTVATNTANVQLNTMNMAAILVNEAYRSPEVQAYIQQMAMNSLPDIMRAVGVNIPYGTVIEGQVIQPMPIPAAPESDPAPQPGASLFNRFWKRPAPAAIETDPAATNDDALMAQIRAMIERGELVVPVSNNTYAAPPQPDKPNGPPPPVVGGGGNSGNPT
jgi:hypothetical protein